MPNCECTITQPNPKCNKGPWLFSQIQPVLKLAIHKEFYDLPAQQRYQLWDFFNQASNEYLKHICFKLPPLDYAGVHRDRKMKKHCETCKGVTWWILWRSEKTGGTILGCGPCKEKKDLWVAVLSWKLEQAKDTTAKQQFNQIIGWVKEHQTYTELDNNKEEWSMGFDFDTDEWRSYSKLYGIILADYKALYQPEGSHEQ